MMSLKTFLAGALIVLAIAVGGFGQGFGDSAAKVLPILRDNFNLENIEELEKSICKVTYRATLGGAEVAENSSCGIFIACVAGPPERWTVAIPSRLLEMKIADGIRLSSLERYFELNGPGPYHGLKSSASATVVGELAFVDFQTNFKMGAVPVSLPYYLRNRKGVEDLNTYLLSFRNDGNLAPVKGFDLRRPALGQLDDRSTEGTLANHLGCEGLISGGRFYDLSTIFSAFVKATSLQARSKAHDPSGKSSWVAPSRDPQRSATIDELVQKLQAAMDEEVRKNIENNLRTLLIQETEVKFSKTQSEIEMLSKRIESLRLNLGERSRQREQVIEERLQKLLGEEVPQR